MRNQTYNYGTSLTLTKTLVTMDGLGNAIGPPGFLGFSPDTSQFSVQNVKINEFGKYQVGIRFGFAEFPLFEVVCLTQLTVSYTSSFTGDRIED